jgi:hypothetical protein
MARARSGLVAVGGLLFVAGVCGGSASASRVVVAPKCIAAYACAVLTVDVVPPSTQTSNLDAGSGSVTSIPAGINCTITFGVESGACTATISWPIDSTPPIVAEVANASTGSGACVTSNTAGCPAQDYAPDVTFQSIAAGGDTIGWSISLALFRETVSVTRSGTGSGTVTGKPAPHTTTLPATGINCGSQCTAAYGDNQPMTLTATPSAGSVFTQWTGACTGQGATCTLTPRANVSTNVVFDLAPKTTTTTTTKSTTTTTATTTTTTTSTGTHELPAQLIDVKPGRSRLGLRLEQVEIQTSETLAATLFLTRNGKRIALAALPDIRSGDRVLTLPIPSPVKKGKATLAITLSDSTGHHHTWTRTVSIPS